jgi:hypothetical protein
MVTKEKEMSNDNDSDWGPYWTFPPFPENNSFEVRYLCWRACGETREESTRLANEGYMPASWYMVIYREND